MKNKFLHLLLILFFGVFVSMANANFVPGNLVIYRVGDGVAPLANTGSLVFLDEFDTTGAPVSTSALPVDFIADGLALDEGQLNLSTDDGYLLLSGYNSTIPAGASLSTTASALINRRVGVVDYTQSIDATTNLSDWANNGAPKSVASVDGNAFWLGSSVDGVRYATLGSGTSTSISTTLTDVNFVDIVTNQLMTSAYAGAIRLGLVGSGLPTSGPQAISNLTGIPATGSHYSYAFFDLNNSVAGVDTLYLSDDVAGTISKYSLVGVTWTLNGTITLADVRGLVGIASGSQVTLYATTDDGAGTSNLTTFTDSTGYNTAPSAGVPAVIQTASANTAFRGIAFSPLATPINTVPIAQTTPEDTALVFSLGNGNLISTSDPDNGVGDILRVVLNVSNGSITLNGTSGLTFIVGDGSADASMTFTGTLANINTALNGLSYSPNLNYFGADTLTLTVGHNGYDGSGGAKTDTDTVGITVTSVNDNPVVVADTYTTNEDTNLTVNTASGILANDSDVDGPSLVVFAYTSAGGTINSIGADGSFSYTPATNFCGTDSFNYQAWDGSTGYSAFTTVTINVTCINDAPINNLPASQTTGIDTPIVLSTGNGNLISLSDADVSSGTLTVSIASNNGTHTLASFVGLIFGVGDGVGDALTTITGSLANINLALDGLTFIPTASFSGVANISLNSSDNGNTGSGGVLSDLDSLTINVTDITNTPSPTPTGSTATPTSTYTPSPTPTVIVNDPYILKTVNNSTPVIGQSVIFTLSAANPLTNSSATGVILTDTLPSHFTVLSTTTTLGSVSVSGNSVIFSLGTLAPGQSATMTITALVNSGASASTSNTATLTGFDADGYFSLQASISMSISGSSGGSSGPTTCTATPPGNVPDLFQIDTTNTTATLHFAPAGDPYTGYFISYGYNPSAEGFSASIDMGKSSGAIKYTVNLLNPSTKYYFKVRAYNSCQTGNFSNIINVETTANANTKFSFDRTGNILGSRSGSSLPSAGIDLQIGLVFGMIVILSTIWLYLYRKNTN